MKILIIYTQAGEGHRRAALALYNYLKKNHQDYDTQVIDTLDYSSPLFKYIYNRSYTLLVTKLPWIWAVIYHISRIRILRGPIQYLRYFINSINTKKLISHLLEYAPDYVVATHFLPPCVVSGLKLRKLLNSALITVITDYNVHPFWLSRGSDLFIVACTYAKNELLADNIPENKIRVLGIPVDAKFQMPISKEEARRKLNIENDKFTVLLATSGFGLGPLERITDLLQNEIQLLVVCGRNKTLYNNLAAKKYPFVQIFGFVDNIEELMAASDIIITKPGGMTISESLAMGLPMIFIAGIAGQEARNAAIMADYGVAITALNTAQLKDAVLELKNNPQKLQLMKEKVKAIRKPDAAKEICACFLPK